MSLSREEENFIKITKIVLEIFPKYLRSLFIEKWDQKYPNNKWQSDNVSGDFLFNEIPNAAKKGSNRVYANKLQSGNENNWDTTTLVYAMLYSELELIPSCRPNGQRSVPLLISEEIDIIRKIRNEFFAHASTMNCSFSTFLDIVSKVNNVAKNIFGIDAEHEVEDIVKSKISTEVADLLKQQLLIEKNRSNDFGKCLKDMNESVKEVKNDLKEVKDDGKELKQGLKEFRDEVQLGLRDMQTAVATQPIKSESATVIHALSGVTVIAGDVGTIPVAQTELPQPAGASQTKEKLPPYTKKDIDDLKTSYKERYQKHQIHIVDENGRIKLEEVDIDKFVVKLEICKEAQPSGNFRDEARKYVKGLRSVTGDDIEVSQLLDTKNRVIFIRAVAGMGKTTLSKQLIASWSRDEIYNDIKVCMMFECRIINVLRGTRGSHLQTNEIFEEMVKTTFPFDLNDGKDVLFVIDGLDEILGTSTYDCIIKQLFNRDIYPYCKIIVTGRPHVQWELETCGEVGGLKRVEIQGLSTEQIAKYISKFPFPEGGCINLNSVQDSLENFYPLLRIPQFLNTFFCIIKLLDFQAIHSEAELYCWTIYLLLKQHADKHSPSERKSIPDIFNEYSKDLLILGEICHKLLGENKIIIPKEDLDARLVNCERGREFIGSLFLDASDDCGEKFQFKHLSIMEFLSAIHISSSENPLEMISDNLKNGFLEVVIFVCQLISGWSSKRIISEMVKVNAGKLKQININSFCHDVVKALYGCKFDEETKFLNSLDIIDSCLNDDAADKAIFLSTVQMLSTESVHKNFPDSNETYKGIDLSVEQTKTLHKIYKHMVNIFEFNDEELFRSFQHVHAHMFGINDTKCAESVKYLGHVNTIALVEMKLNVNEVRHEIESTGYGKCKSVDMIRCELEDTEIERQFYSSNLNSVGIHNCELKDIKCLLNVCQWAASSSSSTGKILGLVNLKIANELWSALVTAIEEGVSNGKMKLLALHVCNCTPTMQLQLQRKILQCGIILIVDQTFVKLEDLPATPVGTSASALGSSPSHGSSTVNPPPSSRRRDRCMLS